MTVREAVWSDIAPHLETGRRDDEPFLKHHGDDAHPFYLRSDDAKTALVEARARIDGPARIAPDICGTLTAGSTHRLAQPNRCDPSLPFGAIVPDA